MTIEEKQEILIKLYNDFKEADQEDDLAFQNLKEAKKKVEEAKKKVEEAEKLLLAATDARRITLNKADKASRLLNYTEENWNLSLRIKDSDISFEKYYK